MPILTLIAGPNGSGKSTLAKWVSFEGRDRLLDTDAIARMLSPSNPSSAAMAAGREVLRRIDQYVASQVSFSIETTLSSRRHADLIRSAKSRGYSIHLAFIGIDNAERCIARIRTRVARGGHSVPDAVVKRRYTRSMANAANAIRSADIAKVYDNSGDGHRLVMVARGGAIAWTAESMPRWVEL